MNEEWIETNNKGRSGDTVIKVSNMGRICRKNGNIEESTYKQRFRINGIVTLIHKFIADYFIPKTYEDIELKRDCIDHISHYPIGMNVNDTRNLRWCTHKENSNFDEARKNNSKSHLNKPKSKSEFGKKYYDHYGYSRAANINQYMREYRYYRHNGKYSWE